ncbi:hypothetical protein ACIPM2_31960 [Streptomyces sp. NPDC086081]|uniref:hypothetical protein n=1 Tax=Streptomyces sp. NPDC086081 TaxID=3365749 RepID=UPI0038057C71
MNAHTDHEDSGCDLSTWTLERLQSFAAEAHGPELETVRIVAQGHAYFADGPPEVRKQWAKVSLQANQRLHGDSSWDRARAAQQNSMLRMWVIDEFGPDEEDADWSPEAFAITRKSTHQAGAGSGRPHASAVADRTRSTAFARTCGGQV